MAAKLNSIKCLDTSTTTVIKVLTLRRTELFDQYSCVSEYTPAFYRCIVSESPLSMHLDKIVQFLLQMLDTRPLIKHFIHLGSGLHELST
jgi:hypothetical protein